MFSCSLYKRKKRNVNIDCMSFSKLPTHLPYRFKKRQAFNITNSPANFNNRYINIPFL